MFPSCVPVLAIKLLLSLISRNCTPTGIPLRLKGPMAARPLRFKLSASIVTAPVRALTVKY